LLVAFGEAAVALRTLVDQGMQRRHDPGAQLKMLYRIAAVLSFMPELADCAKVPGFNVVVTMPGSRLLGLECEWNTLDCERLPLLLNKDVRMLIALRRNR
jgi:hypothetical protein